MFFSRELSRPIGLNERPDHIEVGTRNDIEQQQPTPMKVRGEWDNLLCGRGIEFHSCKPRGRLNGRRGNVS